MEKEIELRGRKIKYKLLTHARAKRVKLTMYSDGRLVLTKPKWVSQKTAMGFIAGKGEWILKNLVEVSPIQDVVKMRRKEEYARLKEQARGLITERLEYFNKIYGYSYKRVAIRNQKTCWGSCSARGTLSFNYRLILLPPALRDYVIVHELCHLKEMNHSERFWKLVEKAVPNYKVLRGKLRGIS